MLAEPLHLLLVMDERAETSDGVAFLKSVLDHIDRSFDAETETIFVCE
jgi:hypothetical protein